MEVYFNLYKPKWWVYILVSIVVHIVFIIALFLYQQKPVLEVKVKEVKIKFVSNVKEVQNVSEVFPVTHSSKKVVSKSISRKEVDDIVFEVVAPKISKVGKGEDGTKEIAKGGGSVLVNNDFAEKFEDIHSKESDDLKVKHTEGGKVSGTDVSGKELIGKEKVSLPSSKAEGGEVSGNISWVKGAPRKVIEWYSPEIPPYLLKKPVEVIVTFYIEPSGFVSRVEIAKTSGESLVDDVIYKTMKRIRFSPAQTSTIANVTLQIIPR